MEISWYGGSLIHVKTDKTEVFVDFEIAKIPEPKNKQLLAYTTPSDVDPSLSKHQDRFVINQPGEYEVSGVEVRVLPVNNRQIIVIKNNSDTVAIFNLDKKPDEKIIKLVNGADVLIISVGKNNLDTNASSDLISQIEPSALIPIDYQNIKDIESFLKNENFETDAISDKFQFTKSNLNIEERQNILLKPKK